MELKKLAAILTVVDAGSFSKAAEQLNYTQSGITHMMNSIEKEIGFKLLIRDFRGIRLTHEGERLLPIIKDIVATGNRFDQEIAEIAGTKKLTLFIGAYSSIALIWLPEITRRFHKIHPDVNLEFSHCTVAGMFEAVKNGEIDLGFGSRQDDPDVHWIDLHNDPLLAILPKDYPMNDSAFPVTEFDGKEFLMPAYGFDKDILRVLNKNNVKPAIKSTLVDDSVVISMVGCGLGISILSELVMETGNFIGVKALPLEPDSYRTLGVALKKDRLKNRYIKDFINISQQYVLDAYSAEK